jgi:hypothetical protein
LDVKIAKETIRWQSPFPSLYRDRLLLTAAINGVD